MAAAAVYPLFDESNELQKLLWSESEDLVENPLLETQFFVKIQVSTLHTWLEPSAITSPEDGDGDGGECYTTRQKNLPPVVVEFPLKLFSMASTHDAYSDIELLVSNGVISKEFSMKIKSTLSSCRPLVENIVLKKRRRWVQLILMVEVERVYFETLETKKFEKEDVSTTGSCCGVCLGDFSTDDLVIPMPCSHVFHRHCIFSWLNRSNSCPFCRFEIPIRNEDPCSNRSNCSSFFTLYSDSISL